MVDSIKSDSMSEGESQ